MPAQSGLAVKIVSLKPLPCGRSLYVGPRLMNSVRDLSAHLLDAPDAEAQRHIDDQQEQKLEPQDPDPLGQWLPFPRSLSVLLVFTGMWKVKVFSCKFSDVVITTIRLKVFYVKK